MKTIVDVAALANVSVSTVSHVINQTRPVATATRDRVLHAIQETGYVQHASARALRAGRTDSIGLVVTDTGQPVFAEMVRGVEAEARAAGYTLLLANSAEDFTLESRAVDVLRERRVDGLIIARCANSKDSIVADAKKFGMPLVLMDRLDSSPVDQVGAESEQAMGAIVDHLVQLGHRRIAIAAGNMDVATLRERYDGFNSGLKRHRISVAKLPVYVGSGLADETQAAVREMLSGDQPPTAIVACSSLMAAGALRAIRDCGLSIPTDVAFVAFDSLPFSDLFSPPITSIIQPAEEIGRQAFQLLLRRLTNPKARQSIVRLPPAIDHQMSCGCPSGAPGISV